MDKVSISINLPGVKVTKIEEDNRGDLLIYVETTEKYAHCHRCGKKITRLHGHGEERKLKHLLKRILPKYVYDKLKHAYWKYKLMKNL